MESDEEDFDEIEANFVNSMKKGTRKFRDKLPFKCFSCGKIFHYASRFSNRTLKIKNKEGRSKMVRKSYYVKYDEGVTDDESYFEDGNVSECLFIAIKEEHVFANLANYVKEGSPKEKK